MAVVGHLLKKQAVFVLGSIETPDFVGRTNELFRNLNDSWIGPDVPSAFDSVISGTAKRVPVHCPKQYWFARLGRLIDTAFQIGKPIDLLPSQLITGWPNMILPGSVVFVV